MSGNLLYENIKIGKVPAGKAEKKWSLVIRPERLSLIAAESKKSSGKIYFQGQISELVYQGETAIVMIRLNHGQDLTARVNTRAGDDVDKLSAGQSLTVAIDKKDMIIIPGEAQ